MPTIWKTAPRMSCAAAWGWSSTGTAPLLGREAAGYVRTGIAHDLDRKTPHVSVRGTSRSWTAMAVNPGRTVLEASAGFHVSLSGNWSAGVDYSLEAGNRQLNQSGRAGVMMEF